MLRKLLTLVLALSLLTLAPATAPAGPGDGGDPPRPGPFVWMQIDDPFTTSSQTHVVWVHVFEFSSPPEVKFWFNGNSCGWDSVDVYDHGDGRWSLGVTLNLTGQTVEEGPLTIEADAELCLSEPLETEIIKD